MTNEDKPMGKKGNKHASPDKPKRESSIFIRLTNKEKEQFMDFTNQYLGSLSLFFRMAGRNFMKINNYASNKDVINFIKMVQKGSRKADVSHSREVFKTYLDYSPDFTDTSFLIKVTGAEFNEYVGVSQYLGMSPGMYIRMCGNILMDENRRCPEVVAALEILNPTGLLKDAVQE